MALFGSGLTKSMKRQRKAVEAEILAAGLVLDGVEEIVSEKAGGIGSTVSGLVSATLGGSLHDEAHQVYAMEGVAGAHVFVLPYSSTLVLPGEHRAVVEGAAPASFKVVQPWLGNPGNLRLLLLLGMFTCGTFFLLVFAFGWRSPKVVSDDAAMQARLRADPRMRKALSGLKFQWGVGLGVIELDWAVQVRPLGNGRSEVVMATGRYGGLTTYKVGMKKFNELVTLLPAILGKETGSDAALPFLEPVRFEHGGDLPESP